MIEQMRKIALFDEERNTLFPENKIKTTKYNIITFLPLSIIFQFTNYSNIYFLLVAIILAIKEISPQDPTVALIPFIFVVFVGVLVEAFEEIKKWRNDNLFNKSLTIQVDPRDKTEKSVIWAKLKVGDAIKVQKNEIIPADILIVKTSALNHFCYMQTTNLDGESALKPRELVPLLQNRLYDLPGDVTLLEGTCIEVEQPSFNIYKCNGSIQLNTTEKAFITIDNLLLRGTVLKNVDFVYGVIVYTGKDTKIMKNIQPSSLKSSSIEDIINKVLIGVIVFVFVLCVACTVFGMIFLSTHVPNYREMELKCEYVYFFSGRKYNYTLEFFRLFGAFFILFNNIIPISLAITFTIAKVIQILIIEFDPELRKSPTDQLKVLSTRLQEDLGKIEYIFTDKTGTLTRNEMVFKGCSVFGQLYYNESSKKREDELISALKEGKEEVTTTRGPSIEEKLVHALNNPLPLALNHIDKMEYSFKSKYASSKDTLLEFGLNIALNHNVLSEYDEKTAMKSYQGPNPDEVTLVTTAKQIGIEFIERIGNLITLSIHNEVKAYEVLQVFAYSSERKRSGIIVKDKQSGLIDLYVKGADDVLISMCNNRSSIELLSTTKSHLDLFAKSGLRTLCYASKSIPLEQYAQWEEDFTSMKRESLIDGSKLFNVERKISDIESDLLLIGVSGLEDRLQDEVKDDIEKFIEAGIQVWMITGDQMDTAESIGYSSNFFENDTEVYKIRSNADKKQILRSMTNILKEISAMEEQLKQYKIEHNCTKKRPHLNNSFLEQKIPQQYVQSLHNERTTKTVSNEQQSTPKKKTLERRPSAPFTAINIDFDRYLKAEDHSIDDVSVINFMYEKHVLGNSIEARNEAQTFIRYVTEVAKLKETKPEVSPAKDHEYLLVTNPEKLYNHYKAEIKKIESKEAQMAQYTKYTSLAFKKNQEIAVQAKDLNLLNFGLIIEGNALVHCLSKEIAESFWKLIQKSRSIICCRCTPIQKANIVEFVKNKSNAICLAIGDGGNDVNMIKKANVGVGIFGKEGHQAAYNSDYAIGQFKYLKQLLFYHGRYILNRNSYFIYFFFYKGLIFCFPCFWFGFFTGFSGSNFWDFVWFTMYTGLTSTMPPVVYMVFEEDIDVSFEGEPDKDMLKNLLPDIYREYRDSSPFNVTKYFIIFFLAIFHSFMFFFWGYFAFEYGIIGPSGIQFGLWDYSLMCLLTVLIVQYVILFLDTNKYYIWVYLAHAAQILVNVLFGIFYALGNTDELGTYTFDALSNFHFWLILFCSCHICLIPVYFARYFNFLFSDSIINNLRNKKTQNHFAKKMYIKKIEHMTKCTRSLAKFKRIYNALDKFKADNFADRKMKEIVQMYKSAKEETARMHQQDNQVASKFTLNSPCEVTKPSDSKKSHQPSSKHNKEHLSHNIPSASSFFKRQGYPKLSLNHQANFAMNKVDSDKDSLSNLE